MRECLHAAIFYLKRLPYTIKLLVATSNCRRKCKTKKTVSPIKDKLNEVFENNIFLRKSFLIILVSIIKENQLLIFSAKTTKQHNLTNNCLATQHNQPKIGFAKFNSKKTATAAFYQNSWFIQHGTVCFSSKRFLFFHAVFSYLA